MVGTAGKPGIFPKVLPNASRSPLLHRAKCRGKPLGGHVNLSSEKGSDDFTSTLIGQMGDIDSSLDIDDFEGEMGRRAHAGCGAGELSRVLFWHRRSGP